MIGFTTVAIRSLLEIFIHSSSPGEEITLNCDECFSMMEFFVDPGLEGVSMEDVKKALRQHINHCPDCREHHLQRLQELEDHWQQVQDLKRLPQPDYDRRQ